ncbi:hypothetical protein H8356DRAFT_1652055 [Neocallimastix lanati (nom. inval.)]|nr:hypothetical protein H8356DRAFT_1652055 [Neocallimastix sp. JGI-2020a]
MNYPLSSLLNHFFFILFPVFTALILSLPPQGYGNIEVAITLLYAFTLADNNLWWTALLSVQHWCSVIYFIADNFLVHFFSKCFSSS